MIANLQMAIGFAMHRIIHCRIACALIEDNECGAFARGIGKTSDKRT